MAVQAGSPTAGFSVRLCRLDRGPGRRCRRGGPERRHPGRARVVALRAPAAARGRRADVPGRGRPQPQPPRRAGIRGRRRARAPAGTARPTRARDARPAVDPRPLRLVHRPLQRRQLHVEHARRVGRRRPRPHRHRPRLRCRRPRSCGRLRRRQPRPAGGDAAPRPRPQLPPERPLLRHRAHDGARARRARDRDRRVRAVQPLDPAGPDRAARPRPPFALDRGAAARERGAVPDDVRRGAHRDHALRPHGQDPLRQPLGGVAVRLFRAGDDRQAPDDVPAPGRRRSRRRGLRSADPGRAGLVPPRNQLRDQDGLDGRRPRRHRTRPRRGRQAGLRDRDGRGRDRAAPTRGAAASKPEARSDRPARRRRRPRLQQHADRDRRLHGACARARGDRLDAPLAISTRSARPPTGPRC